MGLPQSISNVNPTPGTTAAYSADDVIRYDRAYRRVSLTVHPDKGGDPAAFRRLTKAHDVLRDPRLRDR